MEKKEAKVCVMELENTSVVITDPGYLMKACNPGSVDGDDWENCQYGEKMDRLGFHSGFLTIRNGFGDGSWTVVNKKNGKKLGEIWADSGQTGIYLLEDAEKYNPDAPALHSTPEKSHGAIILRNFTGKICWSFREERREDPEYEKIMSILGKMGLTLKEAREMGMKVEEPDYDRWSFKYLIMQGIGTCDGEEIEFFVDFGKDFTDSETEE